MTMEVTDASGTGTPDPEKSALSLPGCCRPGTVSQVRLADLTLDAPKRLIDDLAAATVYSLRWMCGGLIRSLPAMTAHRLTR